MIRGEAVAAMGGFTGRETVLTRSYLARLISSGEARYFLLGGSGRFAGPGGSANAAASLISSTCRQVSAAAWSGGSASAAGGGGSLYDCAGRAAAIAGA